MFGMMDLYELVSLRIITIHYLYNLPMACIRLTGDRHQLQIDTCSLVSCYSRHCGACVMCHLYYISSSNTLGHH